MYPLKIKINLGVEVVALNTYLSAVINISAVTTHVPTRHMFFDLQNFCAVAVLLMHINYSLSYKISCAVSVPLTHIFFDFQNS